MKTAKISLNSIEAVKAFCKRRPANLTADCDLGYPEDM